MHYKEPENRNQLILYTSIDSSISSTNPIRIIDALIETIINNNPNEFKYKGQNKLGQKAYSPKTFQKLFIYGYLNKITSARNLETETIRNIEVKWLLGDLQPDFKTIADYRKDNKKQIEFVTKKIRELLKSNKLITGDLVAIDGTKVKAYTKRDMLNIKKIEKRLLGIDFQIEEYLKKMEENDARDELLEENDDIDTSSGNRQLIDKIAKLQEEIEKLKDAKNELESSDKNYIGLSDKEAVLLKTKDGKIPGYNIQGAVDSENMMIMSMYATDSQSDIKEMKPMIDNLKEEYKELPKTIVGDKGYYNADDIMEIEKEAIECITPLPKTIKDKEKIKFTYDKGKDIYTCSEGQTLKLIQKNKIKNSSLTNVYQSNSCNNCHRKSECTKSKKGRIVNCYINQDWRDKYKEKMKSIQAKRIMKKRKAIVEHVFGTIKYWMGQIPLKLRGKEKACTELNIYATAYNIKRLINIDSFENIMGLINTYEWNAA